MRTLITISCDKGFFVNIKVVVILLKIIPPRPFTFEAGPRAVFLLHGFTGNSADVLMLGRY